MTILINPQPSHIRPIHLEKDIRPVADLVELCFAEAMDAEGRAYLHNIRMTGKSVSSLYLSSLTPETTPIPFHGYVWEQDGRIIGNVTLIQVKKKERRFYFIANVSVHPDFRGRGIARKLTERALKHARMHNGNSVMLQVREDNPIAIHIYESQGFSEFNRRTNWVVDGKIRPRMAIDPNYRITRRSSEDWPQQKNWLQEIYPENVTWFLPFNLGKLTPGFLNWFDRWLNSDLLRFWALKENDKLLGVASLEPVNPFQHYIWLATSPVYEVPVIRSLLPNIIQHTRYPQKIQINYPGHRAEETFKEIGMKELNTLIWMETRLDGIPVIRS